MSDSLPPELEGPLIRLWRRAEPIVVNITPRDAFQAVAVIQFATRNPQLSQVQQHAAIEVGRTLQRALAEIDPIINKYLEMGWDPIFDVSRGE